MNGSRLDLVTGAFSYTGRAIARRLLQAGHRVKTLTGHPNRSNPDGISVAPYAFDDPQRLKDHFSGVDTFFNTYWVRFERGSTTFAMAVRHSRMLFEAAGEAGVRRIVHVSVTKPNQALHLPYFAGKAQVEKDLADVGVLSSIVRPTVVFGEGDVLVNNLAWLLRRIPVFGIPGSGRYRLRPVHVDDVARICLEEGQTDEITTIDAVGPETFSFREWVEMIRGAVGSRAWLVRVPSAVVPSLTGLIGMGLRDVLLTRDELAGLMAELVTTDGPATGRIAFSEWLAGNASELGRTYASELGRHFDR
jgi:NADH dehydrogenase